MRFARVSFAVIISVIFAAVLLYAEDIRLGGSATGEGTDPVHFDDDSLVHTPVPTATPIIKLTKTEIAAWENTRNTRDLIIRCKKDLKRYENFMRDAFMKDLNVLMAEISKMHTYAVLHKRDVVEHRWAEAVKDAKHTLALCEEHLSEFKEDYSQMKKNQKKVKKVLDNKRLVKKIQRPWEIEKEYELNERDMFFVNKSISYFERIYDEYVSKFRNTVSLKNNKVEKLLKEHGDLQKP